MKKSMSLFISTFLLAGSINASSLSSDIPLPGGGVVNPMSMIKISLDPLLTNVEYAVICTIKNNNDVGVDMRFDIDSPNGDWIDFYLNNKHLNHLQGTLLPGVNTSKSAIVSFGKGNHVTYLNLDTSYKVEVSNCVGKPILGLN